MEETVETLCGELKAGDEIRLNGERCLFVRAGYTSFLAYLSGACRGHTVDPIPKADTKVQKIVKKPVDEAFQDVLGKM